jgi:hypothetical protein
MSLGRSVVALAVAIGLAVSLPAEVLAAPPWSFACDERNDLYQAMRDGGTECPRYATAEEAVRAAEEGASLLILADGYPEKTTVVAPAVYEAAARKQLRLYVEYPEQLPDLPVCPPRQVKFERGVVTSNVFGETLAPMRNER